MITNRESETIQNCRAQVLDDGDFWEAFLNEDVAPMETVSLSWDRFRLQSQQMPSYIGQNATSFRFICGDRSAALTFDR